ncbi:MAG: twin-arginine translocase TatA/TatE family subunit [Solirubrobacteraceae bacterium]
MGIESPVHLIFIGIVALLVLGPKRLPEMARALGHGLREFREAMNFDGEQPIEHAPVAVHPVVDPSMPQPPATAAPAAGAAVTAQQPGQEAAWTAQGPPQGDPLADSFARADAAHAQVDPAPAIPSSPDAPDRRTL